MLGNVDRMQRGETIDQSLTHPGAVVFKTRQRRGNLMPNDDATPAFHDEEHGAEYGSVFAYMENLGGGRKKWMHGLEHPVFASHIMCLRCNWSKGTAPQYVLA